MKIGHKKQENNFTFKELLLGDVFQSEMRQSIFMKINSETTKKGGKLNAVSLDCGVAVQFKDNEVVFPYRAKLILGEEFKKEEMAKLIVEKEINK